MSAGSMGAEAMSVGRLGWRPWLTVVLFLLCLTCSYVDRQIISLLVEPLKAELHLSDTAIGLLQGFAFALCYAVMGLPIARALDRGNRVSIAAGCIAVWSVATGLCGFVGSFTTLLLARAFTAVGEAGLPPATLSLISDIFPRRLVPRATALFMLGPYLGTGLALLAGGRLLGSLVSHGGLTLPLLGTLEPWRGVFVVVAAPGLALALIVRLVLREPRRLRPAPATVPGPAEGLFAAVRTRLPFLAPYLLGTLLAVLVLFAQTAWLPTFFVRVHHIPAGEVGQMIGPIFLLAGILGSVVAGLFSAPATSDPLRRTVLLMAIAACGLAATSALVTLVGSVGASLALFAASAFCCSILVALAASPVQLISPAPVRAQMIVISAFILSIGTSGGGPFLVGIVTDYVFGDPASVGLSLAAVSGVSALLGLAGLCIALRRLRA